jgi:hypothetical protein
MKFEIIYEIKGTRKHIVTVPDSAELPEDWARYTQEDRDSWIFLNQSSAEVIFEDIDHAKAVSVEWAD